MNPLIRWTAILGASLLLALSAAAASEVSAAPSALKTLFERRCSFASPAGGDRRSPNAVEVLEGDQALSHLRNLKAKRPHAWARAERILRERGYRPTNEVMVMRSTAAVRSSARARKPFAFANSETIQNSSGEVTFWSWDDGVDGTWEGSIYMADYANGVEGVADAQIFFDTPDFFPTWEHDVYVGGPDGPYDPDQQTASLFGTAPPHRLATMTPFSGLAAPASCGARFVQDWGWCLAPACGGVMYDCAKIKLMRGPAFASCVKWGCGFAAVGCAGPALINAYNCRR